MHNVGASGGEDPELPSAVDRSIDLKFSALGAARQDVVTVSPEDSLQVASTQMLLNDYSQLPAVDSTGVVHGVVSWKSIGSRRLSTEATYVKECLEPPNFVNYDAQLLPWIGFISENDFVLVTDGGALCGIVTAADLTLEFGHFARPYMLLNEIELRLRRILAAVVDVDELVVRLNGKSVKRSVCSVDDLTLYQLQSLFDDVDVWKRAGLGVSRAEFVASLHRVRKVRNAIAHVDSKGPTIKQVAGLERFARALRWLSSEPPEPGYPVAPDADEE